MGNFIRTLRQKDSFYGDYVTGFHVVHRTIERSFDRIENIIAKDSQATFAIQNRGFRRYVSLCIQFLSLHHKQEDKFIFPKFQSLSSDFKNEIDRTLDKDHKAIEDLLNQAFDILNAQNDENAAKMGNPNIKSAASKSGKRKELLELPTISDQQKALRLSSLNNSSQTIRLLTMSQYLPFIIIVSLSKIQFYT